MSDFNAQKPISVANFIIDYAHKTGKAVSNLQLQKIMYFTQGAFLIKYGVPLLDGKFSRWQYGPVMKEVYLTFKTYGSSPILNLATSSNDSTDLFNINKASLVSKESVNNDGAFEYLTRIISNLIDINPWDLVDFSHQQDVWYKYQTQILKHEAPDYNNEDIKEACKGYSYLWEVN